MDGSENGDFTKVVRVGQVKPEWTKVAFDVFVKIKYKGGNLSVTGVEGPLASGNARGSCGQIDTEYWHRKPEYNDRRTGAPTRIHRFAPLWTEDKWQRLLEIWHDWHLNDMRAACEHQTGPEWDTGKQLEVYTYSWGPRYHELREKVTGGTDPAETAAAAALLAAINAEFGRLGLHGRRTGPGPAWGGEAERLLAEGYIEKSAKPAMKGAGWTYPYEHPEGLLCKPCPVCGHKYGSAWLRVDVPESAVEFLRGLPDADKKPAWV